MTDRLEGKTVFITGGNSGIGLATAKELTADGATVIILARTREKADDALAEIGGKVDAVVGDVADLPSLKHAIDQAAQKHGPLDGVFVNAGIAPPGPLASVSPDQFDQIFDVNVKGAFFTVQYALPHLREGSSVVLVSSSLSEMGIAGFSVYSASKAALRSLARSLTPELVAVGARINVLSPGPVKTPVLAKAGLSEDQISSQYAVFDKALPAGRVGDPEEMAKAARFMLSADSTYMFGAEIQADGGMNQTRWYQ